ncbi:DUF6502 family protein [Siccirubricoccus sp. KC 17139]|uniref:DUF6502 family protein n=1 Tax=Siccirubricoccus soli TaxID=2899147 RepID=A0ABT1DB72_9PROT|nr:DUF6502 family protein [Siccirubricoccus soli]MCO6419188.1 DUF6502 family protein [Siccirubricoccus soli]MCP2685323.1 DUF6502 family protein [Siccirubricoccus soli]
MPPASPPPPAPPAAAPALSRALRRALRPLVGFLIGRGVTFPILAEELRRLYVEVAQAEGRTAGRHPTDSRVSLLTGVHRKELRRLREAAAATAPPPPEPATLAGQVIGRWLGLPAFTDAEGKPLPLPRLPPEEGGPSFESLVAGITTDLRARTVADAFLAQGIVTALPDGRLALRAEAVLPAPGSEAQLHYLGRNIGAHIAAACANAAAQGAPPALERSLHFDALRPEVAAKLEAAGREAAQRLLAELNRLALALLAEHGEAPPGSPAWRLTIGVYALAEDGPEAPPAP